MKNFEKNIVEIWIEIFVFEFWKKMSIGNGKNEKKNRFWNLDWKFEICHENLKWKFWNFHF
jgi:hypothetical protein